MKKVSQEVLHRFVRDMSTEYDMPEIEGISKLQLKTQGQELLIVMQDAKRQLT